MVLTASCAATGDSPEEILLEPTSNPPETGLLVPSYEMYGFSFVDSSTAGLPQPGKIVPLEDDLDFLREQGIALLVSLTVTPTDPDAVIAAGMQPVHLPIEDFHAPTPEQQLTFVEGMALAVERGDKVAVHCTAGLGRTGTMLATWFVAKGMAPEAAIDQIRSLRPGSIETEEQEMSIYDFAASWSQAP